MNKTKIRKLLPKLIILLAFVLMVTFALSSCGNGTTIDTSKELGYWSGETETKQDAGSEKEGSDSVESESSDQKETESATGGEASTEGGEDESASDKEDETKTDEENTVAQKKDVIIKAEKNFLDSILSVIGKFLGWITKVMPANSYILTLFIFAIIMEIILLPFSIKQQKNSIRQAKLRPKEMAIRKKYAGRNDQATQQKVTQEIQELYQKENFNPMGGCLPLLIQLPILIVLYWVVVDPIKYVWGYSGEFSSFMIAYLENAGHEVSNNGSILLLNKINDLWQNSPEIFDNIGQYCANPNEVLDCIRNMTNPDAALNFNIGPINFGLKPEFDFSTVNAWLLAVPVLTFVVYFFSMRISRKFTFQPTQSADDRQQACSNNMMDITMPLMSVWMTIIVPGAVGVYWIFKSILSTVKQFIMSKVMPMPKFTEEDYKAAEREILGKNPKKIQKSANAGKVRSLHHIDDEDYDEKGNYNPKPQKEETQESAIEENTAEESKKEDPDRKNMTEGTTLKDESDKGSGNFKLFGKKDKKD